MKKILLLTDVPPNKVYTGGLVLGRLMSFLPRDSLACFAVVLPALGDVRDPDYDWLPTAYAQKPRENTPDLKNTRLTQIFSYALDRKNSLLALPPIAKRAIEFAKAHGVETVWCPLQGPSMFRLAKAVSEGLGVPLLSQVYDPPDWWLISNRFDPRSSRRIFREYEDVLRYSTRCAVASWAMADEYKQLYGVECIPLVPSLGRDQAMPAQTGASRGDEFVLGMAGQIYATTEWAKLLAALDSVNWELAGRRIKIRLLSRYALLTADTPRHIEYLGWRSQPDTIRILSQTDANYCPYRFDPRLENEARLCFPSKLTTYLASGRPVLFHGPSYSSPAHFLAQYDAGVSCHSLDAEDILASIERLVVDEALYSRVAANGRKAFESCLTLDTYHSAFARFLGVDESELAPFALQNG